jgi:type I restriction enzyme R subunit
MRQPGEIERRTQDRVVELFQEQLGYGYLGNWIDRPANSNVEEDLLRHYLEERGYGADVIRRAIHEITKAAGDTSRRLYDRNHEVYRLLRYGAKVKPDIGEKTETVWFIDWEEPERNHFALAQEVGVAGGPGSFDKRPDVVLYVNGIALAVLELKRSTVSVGEGIRQNLDSQKREFIEGFYATVQLVMAGNDTEGLRYGVIGTRERYFLTWKEDSDVENPLDRALLQLSNKQRLLELVHDFIIFDRGEKKICRPHQYFGVRAAQARLLAEKGGIIWHAQGSGKSLAMVWLTKWIREHIDEARVLLVTDRIELDDQIEQVFRGVEEPIERTRSGGDLIAMLNHAKPWLMCSLVHKFGGRDDDEADPDVPGFIAELKRAVPPGFAPKGKIFVFVDECHRTQSGVLHDAMKELLPDAIFVGFTGTPLLRSDKVRSVEIFGSYIHTYLFREAVADGVILDLLYEARDIDQRLLSPERVDQWFEANTSGLTDVAKAQLKQRWGTMQEVLSSQSRLNQIVGDIMLDMETRDRLKSGGGNAMLVAHDIGEACRYYDLFRKTDLKGRCAIITSYRPSAASIKGEESGEGETDAMLKFATYRRMLADWFREPEEVAATKTERFEDEVKDKFINEPGQMKLLIVVNRLLTGFDAPPATYLYIDQSMRDHGLFQAVCRVNRLDTPDKRYGYIVDYMDLFQSLTKSMHDYSGAFSGGAFSNFDEEDIAGLLTNRLDKSRSDLDEAREAVKALVEPVQRPRDSQAYLRYFVSRDPGDADQIKANEASRVTLYRLVASYLRSYANLANEMEKAGYTPEEADTIRREVDHFEKVREEVKLASGDYVDLKLYEPAMRHLLDTYIQADPSRKISVFDDKSLMELIIERGPEVVANLPEGLSGDEDAAAETITNNVRKLIIENSPVNPRYYERMAALLAALIEERRRRAMQYEEFLRRIGELAENIERGPGAESYPEEIRTPLMRAFYDNLGQNEALAVAVEDAFRLSAQDGWNNGNAKKERIVAKAMRRAVEASGGLSDAEVSRLVAEAMQLAANHPDD